MKKQTNKQNKAKQKTKNKTKQNKSRTKQTQKTKTNKTNNKTKQYKKKKATLGFNDDFIPFFMLRLLRKVKSTLKILVEIQTIENFSHYVRS